MEGLIKCQMTTGKYDSVSRGGYEKCNRPAKFRAPESRMGVEFVCGIHARSLDKMYERIGKSIRCHKLGLD